MRLRQLSLQTQDSLIARAGRSREDGEAKHRSRVARLLESAVALAISLTFVAGCASQRVQLDQTDLPTLQRRENDGRGAPVRVSWHVEHGVLLGEIEPQKACRDVVIRRERVTTTRYRRDPAAGNDVFMLVAGSALAGVGLWALAEAPEHQGEETCTTNEAGEESCVSDSSRYAVGGLAGIGIGGLFIYLGREALGGRQEQATYANSRVVEERQVDPSPIPCAATSEMEGMELTGTFGKHELRGRADAAGKVSIPLPAPSPGAPETVSFLVSDVPQALRHAIPTGAPAGRADVQPWITHWRNVLADAAAKRLAQRREAIQNAERSVQWNGRFFGDTNLGSLATACAATGIDVCFDAVDNDCDGIYDDDDCGYRSGAVQWTLAWAGHADLDLHVLGPDGVEVYWRNRTSRATKLQLD
ncbi:MAG: hypothetical protein ACOC1F_03970, partial [Myxococcota bacterium]